MNKVSTNPASDTAIPSYAEPQLRIMVAAQVLGLTIREVRALCESGDLAHLIVDGKTYVTAESLREYIATGAGDHDEPEERLPLRLPRAMTCAQAADLLGLSPWTVYGLVQSGELPAFHVGPAKDGPETRWIHPNDVARHIVDRDRRN